MDQHIWNYVKHNLFYLTDSTQFPLVALMTFACHCFACWYVLLMGNHLDWFLNCPERVPEVLSTCYLFFSRSKVQLTQNLISPGFRSCDGRGGSTHVTQHLHHMGQIETHRPMQNRKYTQYKHFNEKLCPRFDWIGVLGVFSFLTPVNVVDLHFFKKWINNHVCTGIVGDILLNDVPLTNFTIYSLDMTSNFINKFVNTFKINTEINLLVILMI